MSVTITSVIDRNNKAVTAGGNNTDIAYPLTVQGTATKHNLIVLWVNKVQLPNLAPSIESGAWSQKIEASDVQNAKTIELVANEVSYHTGGTFNFSC